MRTPSLDSDRDFSADIAACNAMLRGGSRTFFAASKVLPRSVREPATALYAFCRLADDAVDLDGGRAAALARLRARVDRAYEARPYPTPADRAFADVVRRFAIPRPLPLALLEGLSWDVQGRRYADFDALVAYAVRVAGTVGMMMSILMGGRTSQVLARACDLGVAMQLTNIARDVGEDARCGRLYLPLQWLQEAGIDPDDWLANPIFCDGIAAAVRRLLGKAESLYLRSRSGINRLPVLCRPGIHAARLLYCAIGHDVARAGYDSISRRAVVPWPRKGLLLARAIAALSASGDDAAADGLPQAKDLLDAVASAMPLPPVRPPRTGIASAALEGRIVWLIDLFEQLERRQQSRPLAAVPQLDEGPT